MAFVPTLGTGFEPGHIGVVPVSSRITIMTTPVKTGTYSLRVQGQLTNSGYAAFYCSGNEVYIGVWAYPTDATKPLRIGVELTDGNRVWLLWTGTWSLYINSTWIVSGTVITSASTWQHVQMHIVIGDSGSVQTKVEGIDDIDYSGDTKPGTSDTIQYVLAWTVGTGSTWISHYIDDIVYGTGDWPGDVRFNAVVPDGDDSVQWTPSTGVSNYALVDEKPPVDTDYVSSDVAERDVYTSGDWAGANKTNIFVVHWLRGMKDTAGSRKLKMLAISNGAESIGAEFDLATSYTYYSRVITSDPCGGSTWTESAIDALKIGMEST